MKKVLCAAIAVIGTYVCEGMRLRVERSVDFSTIKIRDIPEDPGSVRTGFIQGGVFVFTCAVDLNKLCSDIIAILSDESKYSPDVNGLLCNENLLKNDDFPRSLNFISLLLTVVPPEKKATISSLVPQVEDFICKQYNGLVAEYSGSIEAGELLALERFFFQRLQALRDFPKWPI